MIENTIYKGDYLHGKRNKYPTYYEDVIVPIVSKEMWKNCQVRQQKNSRSYQRYQTYLFLQKLKFPVCGRIMGGKAIYKKKFDRTYYYYGCNECKNNIKEYYIEESILELLGDIFEYDLVVNEFFLLMIKSKISKLNKDNYILSKEDNDSFIDFIEQVDNTNKEYDKIQTLSNTLVNAYE